MRFPIENKNSSTLFHQTIVKGSDLLDIVVEPKVQYCKKNFRIHLIPMRFLQGTILNKSVKSFVIFHQLFQSAEGTFFTILK